MGAIVEYAGDLDGAAGLDDSGSADNPVSAPLAPEGSGEGLPAIPEAVSSPRGSSVAGSVDEDRSADGKANGPGDPERAPEAPAPKPEGPAGRQGVLFQDGDAPRSLPSPTPRPGRYYLSAGNRIARSSETGVRHRCCSERGAWRTH